MSDKIYKYFNAGYCKFTKIQEGLSVKHPTEVCQLTFCKEKHSIKKYPNECRCRSKCNHGNECF